MLPPLSGIVAKGYKGHKHTWKRGEIRKHGATISLWVCDEHESRIAKAFDMEVWNREAFQGSSEYEMSRHA